VTTATKGSFSEERTVSPLERIQHVLHANPILGPLAVLVLAIIAFSLVSGRFLSAANLGLVLAQVTVIATLALGWEKGSGHWRVSFDDGNAVHPFSKIQKQFENGSEDSIKSFSRQFLLSLSLQMERENN
jgi:hypothetical protein